MAEKKDKTDQGFLRVDRCDSSQPITSKERTPSGGYRVKGNFSRTGVFTYKLQDGSTQREYRPPEEVLHPESVASFFNAPVTVDHPADMVNPDTWAAHAVGHVSHAQGNDPFVSGTLDVNHSDAMRGIDDPDPETQLREISTGYSADVDPTPGVSPEGEPYDVIQRNIRVNHVAMGWNGWGRQGPTVALRNDSRFGIAVHMADQAGTHKRTVRVDGLSFEAGSDGHLEAVEKQVKTLTDAKATAETEAAKQKDRADKAEAAADPKTIAKRVSRRVFLIDTARNALARRAHLDGKGAKAIQQAYRYLDAEDEQASTDDDAIILKAIQAHCPDFDGSGLNHDQLMGVLVGLSHQAGQDAGTLEEGPESGNFEEDADQENGVFPDKGMPGVPSKDAGMVPQPKGSGTSTENEEAPPKKGAMGPPSRAWDSRFIPRGRVGNTETRDSMGRPKNQGETKIKTEAQARQDAREKEAARWRKGLE